MELEQIRSALAGIRAGVDVLRTADLSRLASTELTSVLAEAEVARRRWEPVDQRLIAEVTDRGTAGEYGCSRPVDLLVALLRVSPRQARARAGRAAELGPRRGVTGAPLQPVLPATAAAVASGSISGEHADVILRTLARIPDAVSRQMTPIVEHALLEQALHVHPGQVAKAGEVLLNRIDPDGVEPKDAEQQRRREFGIRMGSDGSGVPYGRFTPEACAIWRPILDCLGRPQPAEDGTRDPRTAGQRGHDAFLEAGRRLLRADLPDNGGVPVTILVHIDLADLLGYFGRGRDAGSGGSTDGGGPGMAQTAHGDLVAVADILRQAAEAQFIPVVLNDAGGVLSYGRTRRLATCGQRLALAARDKGCSFPGCTRPPAWCESHHVIPYRDGGPTDLTNLTLLCGYHHRNFDALGWSCHISDGVPQWAPPAWLDPHGQPRRNTAHHLDIDFDTG